MSNVVQPHLAVSKVFQALRLLISVIDLQYLSAALIVECSGNLDLLIKLICFNSVGCEDLGPDVSLV
jgi:hypothetical protein